ncbi:hypothetical protein PLEOSDRAFT_31764 [Pleurotus ostreatus PC15]|uniref:Ribosomal L1 domain-containing protein 1 n=1 Tax=Pleurotus ostreatus (strain PC15) TaxID=1137138 RepID=A0A067NBU1_PLEO1|nr:hypothetical protein PLEOSDRAFT_31764 [Pleurotus ostreatus PC15]
MAPDELIDSHVSLVQCTRAVDALIGHESKAEEARNENELLPGKEQNVWLVVTVKKMAPSHKIKPVKIPIKHPIVDPRTTPICLITKDPQREYKDLLEEKGIKFISRVVGISKLKGKFKPYEARRMLLKENGMFLADDRIIPILPKLLGSKWFQAKKQPIPVSLARKDLKGELERAISSTYMHQNQGTCTSIKVGTLSQKPTQILANIKTALPAVISAIKDGWDNIQSLHIKTNSSVSLPIWSCSLDDESGGRWDGLIADAEALSEGEKPSKLSKKEKTAAPAPPPPSIKPEDLKKKRLAEAIVKKKEKTVALKASKSVKAALLGKKVAKS